MKTPKAKKLPSGSWFVRVRVNGQDICVTRDTEKAAVAEAMAIKAGIMEAKKRPDRKTLKEAYHQYIDSKSNILSPSTIAGYNRLSRNTYQSLMSISVCDITPALIQRETNFMAKTHSPKYVRNAHGLLSAVLQSVNPGTQLTTTLPQKKKYEIVVPSTETQAQILRAAADTEIELPVNLAITMGLRMSEIRGLRMQHVKNGKLHVCQAIVDAEDGSPKIKTTKTFSGDRWLSITDNVQRLIDALPTDTDYLVTLSAQAIYKRFERMLEKNKIPHMRFHDLRHAYASTMLMLGIPNKYIVERMGHSSDRMLQAVYQHIMDEKRQSVDDQATKFYNAMMKETKNGNTTTQDSPSSSNPKNDNEFDNE